MSIQGLVRSDGPDPRLSYTHGFVIYDEPHRSSAVSASPSSRPFDVTSYSTQGGMTATISRLTISNSSRLLRRSRKVRELHPPTLCASSLKRRFPLISSWMI